MKPGAYRNLAAITAAVLALPNSLIAQTQSEPTNVPGMHHHYVMIDLGTFGGPMSRVSTEPDQRVINTEGTIVGQADTSLLTPAPDCFNPIENPDCFIVHAFAWRSDHLKDLGTLPGGNFSSALEINQRGQIAGLSETSAIDPALGTPEFHAVLWDKDNIQDLGTLGGTASFAEVLNNHGQVVGNSLNAVPDPLSIMGLTQTHAFIWQHGRMEDLGTLGGPDSWASFVNERGQVAGASYTNDVVNPNTGVPQIDLFIWENGKMRDLGNLGGSGLDPSHCCRGALPWIVTGINDRGEITGGMTLARDQVVDAFLWDGQQLLDLGTLGGNGSYAEGINNRGEVAGVANLPGDRTEHGFLWRNGEMIDLGTLGGDPCSSALALNSKGQVIGASESAAGGCDAWTTAFLWENDGPMVDLNSLVSSGSGAHLAAAEAINDRGEIAVAGAPPGCDVVHSDACQHIYALIPCDENHPDVDDCDYSLVTPDSPTLTRPKQTRESSASTPNGIGPSASESRAPLRFMMRGRGRFSQIVRPR